MLTHSLCLQAAQEQVHQLEADLAAALDASGASDGASAGVLRAEVAMLQVSSTCTVHSRYRPAAGAGMGAATESLRRELTAAWHQKHLAHES